MKKKLILLIVFVLGLIIPSAYAYSAEISMKGIGLRIDQVIDNGLVGVGERTYRDDKTWDESSEPLLLGNNREVGDRIVTGKTYPLRLSIANTGLIDSYDRVTIYKYFKDQNIKRDDINPAYIEYKYPVNFGNYFIIDEDANTPEREVLYYRRIFPIGGTDTSVPEGRFLESIKVDNKMMLPVVSEAESATTSEGNKVAILKKSNPSAISGNVEVELEAVQTHNAKDAILSAWGRHVNISSNGELSLA